MHSESFYLVESSSVSRSVFANEGDRLVGNFTVSNIPSWTDAKTGNFETVQYAFKVSKIEGLEQCPTDIVLYEADQKDHASFDVVCEYTGDYRFRFNVGTGAPDLGIGSMAATLNYEVVKNYSYVRLFEKTPTLSPTQHPTINTGPKPPQIEPFPTLLITAVSVFAVGSVIVSLLFFRRHRKTMNEDS